MFAIDVQVSNEIDLQFLRRYAKLADGRLKELLGRAVSPLLAIQPRPDLADIVSCKSQRVGQDVREYSGQTNIATNGLGRRIPGRLFRTLNGTIGRRPRSAGARGGLP